MNLLITADTLNQLADCRIFDCRAHLGDVNQGYQDYQAGHIPGAQHADLDQHLSSANTGTTGRHPLPDRSELAEQFRQWGINADQPLICYDAAGGQYAARFWWLARWLGHNNVQVLDGGLAAWQAAGFTTNTETPNYPQGNFEARTPLTRICEVTRVLDPGNHLIDARDAARFRGEVEPIDPVAGHIPGAICVPFSENLEQDRFRSPASLLSRFRAAGIEDSERLVCYCGSGVTATHNIFAMMLAGLHEPALYPGSWSEWVSDPERPIATGNS